MEVGTCPLLLVTTLVQNALWLKLCSRNWVLNVDHMFLLARRHQFALVLNGMACYLVMITHSMAIDSRLSSTKILVVLYKLEASCSLCCSCPSWNEHKSSMQQCRLVVAKLSGQARLVQNCFSPCSAKIALRHEITIEVSSESKDL